MAAGTKHEEKVGYKIGEVASLTNLPSYVLRFWESEFIFLKPKKVRANIEFIPKLISKQFLKLNECCMKKAIPLQA